MRWRNFFGRASDDQPNTPHSRFNGFDRIWEGCRESRRCSRTLKQDHISPSILDYTKVGRSSYYPTFAFLWFCQNKDVTGSTFVILWISKNTSVTSHAVQAASAAAAYRAEERGARQAVVGLKVCREKGEGYRWKGIGCKE